jgi:5-hydroxyisourate hydrolase
MQADDHHLTTHALDTTHGRPVVGLPLTLFRIDPDRRTPLGAWVTNGDGRSDMPLLAGAELVAGTYEIVFDVASWRARNGDIDSGFYDLIPIRFHITDAARNYHVPLLLAPYAYSTYRGS